VSASNACAAGLLLLLIGEVRPDPCSEDGDEFSCAFVYQPSGLVHIASGRSEVAVLDSRPGLLRSYQAPAELFAEHSGVAQGHECLVGWRGVALCWRRELRELGARLGKVGYEVLDSAKRSLDSLDAVVCADVIGGVECALELVQVELAEG
jgi:hypothetical protein